jgi:hypothetical protein
MGALVPEAELRVHAGRDLIERGRQGEGDAELRKAIDFYRSVGATFYVARAEQLLAKSA